MNTSLRCRPWQDSAPHPRRGLEPAAHRCLLQQPEGAAGDHPAHPAGPQGVAHVVGAPHLLGKTKQPGTFRTSQNWIGVSLKNAIFIPPHHNHVQDLMSDMEKFLHEDQPPVPLLIKIAIGHYQFETIHPFLDGNGRLGRLMISLNLASEKLLAKPALYLSDYFERNKTAYVDHLMAVRQSNQMREWVIFFLHGVCETAREAAAVFKSILNMKERIEREVMPRFSARRQNHVQTLVRRLYGSPVIDVKAAMAELKTTKNTAISLIMDLVEYGLLTEVTGQRRNRLFVFREYLDLFKRQNA